MIKSYYLWFKKKIFIKRIFGIYLTVYDSVIINNIHFDCITFR